MKTSKKPSFDEKITPLINDIKVLMPEIDKKNEPFQWFEIAINRGKPYLRANKKYGYLEWGEGSLLDTRNYRIFMKCLDVEPNGRMLNLIPEEINLNYKRLVKLQNIVLTKIIQNAFYCQEELAKILKI